MMTEQEKQWYWITLAKSHIVDYFPYEEAVWHLKQICDLEFHAKDVYGIDIAYPCRYMAYINFVKFAEDSYRDHGTIFCPWCLCQKSTWMNTSGSFYVCYGCNKGYSLHPEGGFPVFWASANDLKKADSYNIKHRRAKKRIKIITPSINGNKSRRLRSLSW